MKQIKDLKGINNSQDIDWNKLITGTFASDKWHLPDMFDNYPDISKKNAYFDYIQNPYLKAEIKYFFMYKLLAKEYAPSTLATGHCQSCRHLYNFLEAHKFKINSYLELNLKKTLIMLRTWLLEQGYSCHDRAPTLLRALHSFYLRWYDTRDEYDKEIWDLRRMYPKSEHPIYVGNRAWYMNFTFIKSTKLCTLIKRFYKMRVAIRALQTVHKEIRYLKHFIIFIQKKYPHIDSFSLLERHHLEEFYIWLAEQKNQYGKLTSTREKRYTVQYLRLFFEYFQRINDKDAPAKPLVYPEDECGSIKRIPRFIPDKVYQQLEDNLHLLLPYIRNAVIIVMNVGMRASELLTLKEDCISYDKGGTPWLQYYMSKMSKEHCVPTNQEVVDAVNRQRKIAANTFDPDKEQYLFRTRKGLVQYQRVTAELRKLSKKVPITDDNGNIYYINFHQFRHTVGTRMINAGAPVTSVQRYLGHESPEMTMVYAHIHDQTLKKDFEKVIKKSIFDNYDLNLDKSSNFTDEITSDMEWFKHNLYKNALPNGYCLHHPKEGNCPHANACLTCPKFTTSKSYLPVLKEQLCMTDRLIKDACNRGWDRENEHQINIAKRLKELISSLEKN